MYDRYGKDGLRGGGDRGQAYDFGPRDPSELFREVRQELRHSTVSC